MQSIQFEQLTVGSQLPSFVTAPLNRLTLALYAGASGDHNPIHVDLDFARAAGMPDVFAHGMLSMAYLGRLLTNWVPQQAIAEFSVRFAAITHVGDAIRCEGVVKEKDEVARTLRVVLTTRDENGEIKLSGDAVIALDA